jgi:hypothetical protein
MSAPEVSAAVCGASFGMGLIATVFFLLNPQRYPFRMRRARRAGNHKING